MALAFRTSGPETMPPQTDGPDLKLVSDQHPPKEGVFDSGKHYFFNGSAYVEDEKIDWELNLPENRIYDGVGFFVPGYCGVDASSQTPRDALADQGIATLKYTPARGGSIYETARNPQTIHAKSIHEIGKALLASGEIAAKAPNVKQIDLSKKLLLTHSMGSFGGSEYVLHEPESVDAIVYLAGCNFGHPTLLELFQDMPKGIPKGIWHELIPSLRQREIEIHPRIILQMANYLRRIRTLPEMVSCLSHDASEQTAQIRSMGIFTAYQAYERDILVRADPAVAKHVDAHDIMPNAGHLAPIRRAQKVANWVASTVTTR